MNPLDRLILSAIFNAKNHPTLHELAEVIHTEEKRSLLKELAFLANVERGLVRFEYGPPDGHLDHQVHFALTPKGFRMVMCSMTVRGDASLPDSEDHGDVSSHILNFADTARGVGNGAHPPESSAGCAHDFGTLTGSVRRAESAAERVISRLSQFCPQGSDCLRHDPTQECRVFKCKDCSFEGCALCLEAHDAEPHWSDSQTTSERHGLTLIQGGLQ